MKKEKFTPGPWRYWNGIILDHDGDMDNGKEICSVAKYGEEHISNARLIAAAPEMLEALRDCLTVIEFHAAAAGNLETVKTSPGYVSAISAIRKALGE